MVALALGAYGVSERKVKWPGMGVRHRMAWKMFWKHVYKGLDLTGGSRE